MRVCGSVRLSARVSVRVCVIVTWRLAVSVSVTSTVTDDSAHMGVGITLEVSTPSEPAVVTTLHRGFCKPGVAA